MPSILKYKLFYVSLSIEWQDYKKNEITMVLYWPMSNAPVNVNELNKSLYNKKWRCTTWNIANNSRVPRSDSIG